MPVRRSLREDYPLHLVIGTEDFTFLLSDNFTFSNVDPGGFEMASFSVTRDLPRVQRGMNVRLSSGMQVAWEGRVREVQRSLGAKTLIQCEGYGAILKEQLKAEVFVDRDLTKWRGPTLEEQIEKTGNGHSISGPNMAIDPQNSVPALELGFTGAWVAGGIPFSIATYDAHGLPIGALYYAWQKGAQINVEDLNWEWRAELTQLKAIGDRTGNLRAAGPGAAYLADTAANRVLAVIWLIYNAAGGESNKQYATYWSQLAVYGKGFNDWVKAREAEGIFEYGETPAAYYPSAIAHFCAEQCPGIQPGVIERATQYLVPHASYLTPVTYEQIISDMAKFAGWHWGVWESLTYMTGNTEPRLDFRSGQEPGEASAWVRRNECQSLDIRENIENLYDSAKVTYTEPAGIERSVEVKLDNPVLDAAGLHRQVALSLGTGTKAAAESWGLIQLALLADKAKRIGSATLTEPIHGIPNYFTAFTRDAAPNNATSADRAPWMLRAGIDRLRVIDLPATDAWGEHNDLPIVRVECSGSSTGITTTVEFGLGVNLIETLAAQLQANLVASGAA
jgi:hypothetical protein